MADSEYLKDVMPAEAFYCKDQTYIRNLYELCQKLKTIDKELFSMHVDGVHDDFANWIEKCVGFTTLANELRGITEKEKYLSILQRKLKLLETKENLLALPVHLQKEIEKKIIKIIPFLILLLVVCFILFFLYYKETSEKAKISIKEIDQKVDSFMAKNIMASNILFKHLYGIETILNTSINKTVFSMDKQLISDSFSVSGPNPPKTRLTEKNLRVTNNSVVIFLKNPVWAIVDDTKSMEPTLVGGSYVIQMKPLDEKELISGDIVSYENKFGEIIIHRIVEIGEDEKGWYAVTKGDNNYYKDMEKVRFSQVRSVLIGILY